MEGWEGIGGVEEEEEEEEDDGDEGWWKMSTMKVPPVEGCRATSPRLVEKVERSSWANYCLGKKRERRGGR